MSGLCERLLPGADWLRACILLALHGSKRRNTKMSNENSNFDAQDSMQEGGAPRWLWLAMLALAAVSLVGLGIGWDANPHAKAAGEALAEQKKKVQQSVDSLGQRLSESEQTNAELRNNLQSVTDSLKTTEGQVTTTRKQTSQI